MTWINANEYYERSLRNQLLNLKVLRQSTMEFNLRLQEQGRPTIDLLEIDDAIQMTQALIKSGAHHS